MIKRLISVSDFEPADQAMIREAIGDFGEAIWVKWCADEQRLQRLAQKAYSAPEPLDTFPRLKTLDQPLITLREARKLGLCVAVFAFILGAILL